MKRIVQIAAALLLFAPTGCIFHHNSKRVPAQATAPPLETTQVDNSPNPTSVPAAPTPAPAATTTPPATQPATQPPPPTNPPQETSKPAVHHRKPETKPVEEASNSTPQVSAVGQLSPGDPSDLRVQTDSSLNTIDQTLKKLNRPLSQQDQKTVAQIREFLKQARAALASGDVDGAHTLALKAQVLLNEITH
jgi:hypothetical protein